MCDKEKSLLEYIKEAIDKNISKTQNVDDTVDAIIVYLINLYKEEETEICRTVIDAFFIELIERYCTQPEVIASFALKLIYELDSVDREKMLEVSENYLEYIKKGFGKRSLQYAFVLYVIGVLVRYFRQDSERAFDCLEKSFDIRLKVLGRSHRLTNYSLKEIGKLYESSFKLNRALWAYTTIIDNCDSNTLEEKSVIYWAMVHASNVYCIKSEYKKALEMLNNVLSDMTMQKSGEFENLFAEAYHILALVKLDSGMFIEAEKNIIEALDRCDETMREAKLRYNSTYTLILDGLGKHELSNELREQLGNELLKDEQKNRDLLVLLEFNKLQISGKEMSAKEYFAEMKLLVDEVNKCKNEFIITRVYLQAVNAWVRLEPTGEDELSLIGDMLNELERKITITCGKETIMYALFLYQKALYYTLIKNYKAAYRAITFSLKVQRECVLSGTHVDIYIPSINLCAVCCMHLNQKNELQTLLDESEAVIERIVLEAAKSIDYDAAYRYIKKSNMFTSVFMNVFDKIDNVFAPEKQYDYLLNIKLPFDIFANEKKSYLKKVSDTKINDINSEIAIKKMEGIFKNTISNVEDLILQKRELLKTFSTGGIEGKYRKYASQDVFDNLPKGAFFVEFVEYSKFPIKDLLYDTTKYEESFEARYAVYVLSKNETGECKVERLNDIIEHDDINTLVYVSHNAHNEEDEEFAYESLEMLVAGQLSDYFEKYHTMYIAPDGDLNKISFGTFRYKGNYLEDILTIIYVNTGRDVKPDRLFKLKNMSACIIGNPSFELEINETTFDIFNWRNDQGELCSLPASEIEAEKIHQITGGLLFVKENANKLNFLKYSNKNILHLCTHGYCEDTYERTEDPLLASGIYLAGYNDWLKNNEINEEYGNGFVSAEEISMLDLTSNELAVFSACSSGLGTINFSEGVYGIRTALKLAGTQKCIVSIWRVNDFASAVFMENFYSRLRDNTVSDALKKAKISLRNITVSELRKKGWNERKVVERMGFSKPFIDDVFSKPDDYKPFENKSFWGSFIYHIN